LAIDDIALASSDTSSLSFTATYTLSNRVAIHGDIPIGLELEAVLDSGSQLLFIETLATLSLDNGTHQSTLLFVVPETASLGDVDLSKLVIYINGKNSSTDKRANSSQGEIRCRV
jgi:hypothetical protein